MKKLFVLILVLFTSLTTFAQSDLKTEKIKVDGNCDMCKKRIENAAYIKGVKRADWNETDHLLTVTYRSHKTNKETIEKSVAKAGHNTEDVKATEADYKKLPECCQYTTNTCNH